MELTENFYKNSHIEPDMHPSNDDTTFDACCDQATAQESPSSPNYVSIETVVYKRAGNLELLADIYLPQEVTTKKRPLGENLLSDLTNHSY